MPLNINLIPKSPTSSIKTLLAAAAISSPLKANTNDLIYKEKIKLNNSATLLSAPSSSTENHNIRLNKVNDLIILNDDTSSNVSSFIDEDDDDDNNNNNKSRKKLVNRKLESMEISQKKSTDITRCICEMNHDDGYMICCDKCL